MNYHHATTTTTPRYRYRLDVYNCIAWGIVALVTAAAWGGLYLAVVGI